jgi:cell shape-determining protein MreC
MFYKYMNNQYTDNNGNFDTMEYITKLHKENQFLKDKLDRYEKQRVKRNNYYSTKYKNNEEYRQKKMIANRNAYLKRKEKNNLTIY